MSAAAAADAAAAPPFLQSNHCAAPAAPRHSLPPHRPRPGLTLPFCCLADWHGELLQLPLPPGASPPLLCKVQLYGKDWKDDDDLLGTSKETPLERNGTCRVSGLRLGASGATVTFSYRWIDAVSGPVVLC